jgi:2-polyprenyl-3-methyl-5-hydroxy-6-metoxy-1,4-benzoquinol methylase
MLDERLRRDDLLHSKLASVARSVVGVDKDRVGVQRLIDLGLGPCVVGDAENLTGIAELRGRAFDVVVAGEIIEHVSNPGRLLASCASALKPRGQLVITTPNAVRLHNVGFALFGLELVHPDHVAWFSPTTIAGALQRENLRLEVLLTYQLRDSWPSLEGESILRFVAKLSFVLARYALVRPLVMLAPTLADGLIAVATAELSPRGSSDRP